MLATNEGCELPCWWGITPGQTDWQTVRSRYTAYGGTAFGVPSSTPPWDYRLTHEFTQRDGKVESIHVQVRVYGSPQPFVEDWRRYALDQVLTRYGTPSQVWLFLLPAIEPGVDTGYGITVVYDKLGSSIYYSGPARFVGERTLACPGFRNVDFMALYLQPAPSNSRTQSVFPEGNPFVLSLQNATGLSLEDFYRTFRDPNSQACLDLPTKWDDYPLR